MEEGKYVLGISALFHDSAAVLTKGGSIIAAAQEERFTRKKADSRFPKNAIAYCMSCLPGGRKPDAIAYYEDPCLKLDRIFRNVIHNAPRGAPIWPRTLRTMNELNAKLPSALLDIVDDPERIYFLPHHRSHAASAFYPSPFDEAAVLVVDGVGEFQTTSIWAGGRSDLRLVKEIRFPNSLGLFYSAFTRYCGFKVNSGEYKLMGLAPFGRPVYRDLILQEIIDVKPDGSFALNLKYFEFHTGLNTVSPLFGYLLGQPVRHFDEPLTQHYMDVAASAQAVTNEIMQMLASTALQITGQGNLCLAGGVTLNCVANSHIFHNVPELEGLWIQPAAGDAGGALGAALEIGRRISKAAPETRAGSRQHRDAMEGTYLGPTYCDAEIKSALDARGLLYEEYKDEAEQCRVTAAALDEQLIAGHFDGRMEFGPRALGNRSIFADPRPADMNRRVNLKIKFREGWRPFAPIILEERAEDVFEAPTDSPYMLLVSNLKETFRSGSSLEQARSQGISSLSDLQQAVSSEFNAISHVDYSARPQMVSTDSASRAGRIVRAFFDLTGCPMLLNTSFNVRGEPIVCTPEDAVDCFLNTNLDLLVIGRFIVRRSSQKPWVKSTVNRTKFRAD